MSLPTATGTTYAIEITDNHAFVTEEVKLVFLTMLDARQFARKYLIGKYVNYFTVQGPRFFPVYNPDTYVFSNNDVVNYGF